MTSMEEGQKEGGAEMLTQGPNRNHDKNAEKLPSLQAQQPEALDSKQKGIMDYTTVDGIHLRTTNTYDQLGTLVLKELLDNAIDFVETHAPSSSELLVQIKVNVTADGTSITVSNSSYGKKSLNETRLRAIFDFDTSFSSKRNQYRVSRGYLGDGLKIAALIPFAIADHHNHDWAAPIKVKTESTVYLVEISVNRYSQEIISHIRHESDYDSTRGFTEITISLPSSYRINWAPMKNLVFEYALINTHVAFEIEFKESDVVIDKFKLTQAQKFKAWHNPLSINCYTLIEFKRFILGLHDGNQLVYHVVRKFREASKLPKNSEWDQLRINSVKRSENKISEIYNMLKSTANHMEPTKIQTPFDIAKEKRKNAILRRFEEYGYDVRNLKYNIQRGFHTSREGIRFPFVFEIAIAHLAEAENSDGGLYYFESINTSPHSFNNPFRG